MPSDPYGFVFLARAVDEIGRALWKDAWCGSEVAWGGRTISSFDGHSMLISMRDLPAGHPQSAFASRWLRGGGDMFLKLWKLAAEELQGDPQVAHATNAASRLFSVHTLMTGLFECGALISFGRPLVGGALRLLSRDLWRSELLASRWSSFQIDLWHPFGSSDPYARADLHWLFVEQDNLRWVSSEVAEAGQHTTNQGAAISAKSAKSEGAKSAAARAALISLPRQELLDTQTKDLMRFVERFCEEHRLPTPGDRTVRVMKKSVLS